MAWFNKQGMPETTVHHIPVYTHIPSEPGRSVIEGLRTRIVTNTSYLGIIPTVLEVYLKMPRGS